MSNQDEQVIANSEVLSRDEPFVVHLDQAIDSPFSANSSTGFFSGASRGDIEAQLSHLIQFSSLLLVVHGEQGSGKTVLFEHVAATHNKSTALCKITQAALATPVSLLGEIQRSIGVSGGFPLQNPKTLLNIVQQQSRRKILLLIDNAHELSASCWETLLELARLSRDMSCDVHIVVFADSTIQSHLLKAKLIHDELLHFVDLPNLKPHELHAYVEMQARGGRWRELAPLKRAELQRLHKQSAGVFARVDQLIEQRLNTDLLRPRRPSIGLPKAHLWSIVVVLALMVASYWAQQWFVPDPDTEELPSIVELVPDDSVVSASPLTPEVLKAEAVQVDNAVFSDESERRKPAVIEVVAPSPKAPAPSSQESEPTKLNKVVASAAPILDEMALSALNQEAEALQIEEAEPLVKAKILADKPKPAPTKPLAAKPAAAPTPSAAQLWLQAQPASAYTLQLYGTHNLASATAFAAGFSSVKDLHVMITTHQNKPWYVVVQGSYASRAVAQKSLSALPKRMRELKPWARPLAPFK